MTTDKKTILVTGATGFLGSKVVKRLLSDGYKVVVLKRTTSNIESLSDIAAELIFFDADKDDIDLIFNNVNIDIVIHMATAYGRNGESLSDMITTNITLPSKIMESAVEHKCRYFINTSSFFCKQIDARFEKGKKMYLPEYTLTKHQFRQWGKLMADSGKICFIDLQLEHIYGTDDSEKKFVTMLKNAFSNNIASLDLTDGIQIRDFTPVNDVVNVFSYVASHLSDFSGYSSHEVGTGVPTSLRLFVEKMKKEYRADTILNFGAIPCSEAEIMYSSADIDSDLLTTKIR